MVMKRSGWRAAQRRRAGGWATLLLFVLVALALRASGFGNPNLGVDDQFYLLVGERMHQGLLPYVDVWDRKPLGLFALYALFGWARDPVLAYQLAACASAALTALVICRMVSAGAGRAAATLAGLIYLLMLGPLDGFGGQSPVFYNLLMALAAGLVLAEDANLERGQVGLGLPVAMLLCGLAISFKQTCVFESAFLGLWALWRLQHAGIKMPELLAHAASWVLAGVLPFGLTALIYALAGHSAEFWQAMVGANLHKAPFAPAQIAHQALVVALRIGPMAAVAAWGWLAMARRWERASTRRATFLAGWMAAALLGFVAVPNFFVHYALPLAVPLSVMAGLAFARTNGAAMFAALLAWAFVWYNPADFAWNRAARADMAKLAALSSAHGAARGLLVFDGPPYLYAMTGARFLSPLVFPHHLNQAIERDVSHLRTSAEVARVLAARPGVIVASVYPRNLPVNTQTTAMVRAYALAHCRRVGVVDLHETLVQVPIAVWGDCR